MDEPSNLTSEFVPTVPTVSARRGPTRAQGMVVIGLLIVLLGVQGWMLLRPPQKWEYKILPIADEIFTTQMQQLGDEGWEIVTARRASTGPENSSKPIFAYEIIFKRPKR
jgi:hypothetical protein